MLLYATMAASTAGIVSAHTDNSLSRLLTDHWYMLESMEDSPASNDLSNEILQNDMMANELEDNKIKYTRHSSSNWDQSSSED